MPTCLRHPTVETVSFVQEMCHKCMAGTLMFRESFEMRTLLRRMTEAIQARRVDTLLDVHLESVALLKRLDADDEERGRGEQLVP